MTLFWYQAFKLRYMQWALREEKLFVLFIRKTELFKLFIRTPKNLIRPIPTNERTQTEGSMALICSWQLSQKQRQGHVQRLCWGAPGHRFSPGEACFSLQETALPRLMGCRFFVTKPFAFTVHRWLVPLLLFFSPPAARTRPGSVSPGAAGGGAAWII